MPKPRAVADLGFADQAGLLDLDTPPIPVPAVPGVDGHRARMRARLLSAGPDSLADYEMIEMLLHLALPRRDTKPLARALTARFGSFAAALAAPDNELRGIDGLGDAGVAAFRLVQGAAIRLARAEVINKPVFVSTWDKLTDYLNTVLARERVEHFHILFLDSRNRLIRDEAQARGTINHTPVYPREVIRRALELHATALILAHNHPSGDPTPSGADIQMTRQIIEAGRHMSVTVHDHVVVGNGRFISFRRLGLLDPDPPDP